jgi:hypothetical protein
MKLIKVLRTSKMPPALFQSYYNALGDAFVVDGWTRYVIGEFMADVKEHRDSYYPDHIKAFETIDALLIKKGAKVGEMILIEHG